MESRSTRVGGEDGHRGCSRCVFGVSGTGSLPAGPHTKGRLLSADLVLSRACWLQMHNLLGWGHCALCS